MTPGDGRCWGRLGLPSLFSINYHFNDQIIGNIYCIYIYLSQACKKTREFISNAVETRPHTKYGLTSFCLSPSTLRYDDEIVEVSYSTNTMLYKQFYAFRNSSCKS